MEYSKALDVISHIPFFRNASIRVASNIYEKDDFPSCFQVTKNGVTYKVRLTSSFNKSAIKREARALTCLHENGWRFCPVVVESQINLGDDEAYLIESFLPGKSLDKYGEDIFHQYGDVIAEKLYLLLRGMHQINSNNFHSFEDNGYLSYSDMLISRLDTHFSYLEEIECISHDQIHAITSCFYDNRSLFSGLTPTFMHFDLKPQNILFDRDDCRLYLIDYEFSRFGDPLHELQRADARALPSPMYLDAIWKPAKKSYLQSTGLRVDEKKMLLYHLYFHVTHLPYLIRIDDKDKIRKTLDSFQGLVCDLS